MTGDKKEIAKGLKSSAGYIRRQLAQSLNLRMTPELTFYEDQSIAHGAHISKLLNSIEFAPETEEEDSETEEV
jgi:ribosome-binding factor A